jgi:hypothetical protein
MINVTLLNNFYFLGKFNIIVLTRQKYDISITISLFKDKLSQIDKKILICLKSK